MDKYKLQVLPRVKLGKQAKTLLTEGYIPAVVYGKDFANQNLKVPAKEFESLFKKAGFSTLIDLAIEDQSPVKVVVKDVDYNPLTNGITHIDFYSIKMDEPIEADIPIHFIGESPAVKKLGALLIKNIGEITIKCLPKDLIHSVEVDLSELEEIDNYIFVKDLSVPTNVEVLTSSDGVVAGAVHKRGEEVAKPAEEEVPAEEGAEEKPPEEGEAKEEEKEKESK